MVSVFIISLALVLAPLFAAIPDEPLWSPVLYALVLIAGIIGLMSSDKSRTDKNRSGNTGACDPADVRRPILLMGVFVGLSYLSLLTNWLIVHHGHPVYMDAMLRQSGAYLAFAALAATLSRAAAGRVPAFVVVIAILLGAVTASGIGLQDYLIHIRAHLADWREFATSTPDYFAALLVMTIPITLAMAVGAMSNVSKLGAAVYLVALLIQFMVLFATGSRFALIALAAGVVVFAWGYVVAGRAGGARAALDRRSAIALAVILVMGGAVGAKTIVRRVVGASAHAQNNSALFRWWTWKGAERTALAKYNSVLGTGPGTFPYAYQPHAYVGFTRAAHDSYLQATTDTGIPAGIVLLAALVCTYASGFRAIRKLPAQPATADPPQAQAPQPPARGKRGKRPAPAVVEPSEPGLGDQVMAMFGAPDERILAAGLAGGFLAGLVQNLIDSDWFVTFDGLILWAIGGLLLAYARRAAPAPAKPGAKSDRPAGVLIAGLLAEAVYAVVAVLFLMASAAQVNVGMGDQAMVGGDSGGALSSYRTALSLDPWRGSYYSTLGMNIYPRNGEPANAEAALKLAIAVEPDATNYRRLGKFYLENGRPAEAVAEFQKGIDIGWNDLQLYILSAQARLAIGDKLGAMNDYRTLAAMQYEKIGTIPALGDIVQIEYAQADVPLGQEALTSKNYPEAINYFLRALPILGSRDRHGDWHGYIAEGGTMNPMRAESTGGGPDPDVDQQMRDLYAKAMSGLIDAYTATGKTGATPLYITDKMTGDQLPANAAAAAADQAAGTAKFNAIITQSTKASGGS